MASVSLITSSDGRSLLSEQDNGGWGVGLGPYEDPSALAALMACYPSRCTLHPSDQLALEGPLSRVKSLKKSLRQSFRRMRRSRVSSRKRRPAGAPGEVRPKAGLEPRPSLEQPPQDHTTLSLGSLTYKYRL